MDRAQLVAMMELGGQTLIDAVAICLHGTYEVATVHVDRSIDGTPRVVRVAGETTVPFSMPGHGPRGVATVAAAVLGIERFLTSTRAPGVGDRIECRRSELGASTVNVGREGAFATLKVGESAGRDQIVNAAFMAEIAAALPAWDAARDRFQQRVRGGTDRAFSCKFDRASHSLHFDCEGTKTRMRAAWLGSYYDAPGVFRWSWADEDAPEEITRAASDLPELAWPAHGALRVPGFMAPQAFATWVAWFGATRIGGSMAIAVQQEGGYAYFATFEDA